MSRFGLAVLAAQLYVLAGCAHQPYQAPAETPNPWADAPATPDAAAAPVAPEPVSPRVPAPPPVAYSPNSNLGGTKHAAPIAPTAPTPPPAPIAAPALTPSAPAAPPAPVAKVAKPRPAKKSATPKPEPASAPMVADAKAAMQAPLRSRPALESAGKQILGVGAPLRLVTQLENDAGTWWYVETESGAQGWLRASEIQR